MARLGANVAFDGLNGRWNFATDRVRSIQTMEERAQLLQRPEARSRNL